MELTDRQRLVFANVWRANAAGRWYRAADSGERVTLASLHGRHFLDRRAWRGIEGERDAAHEYCVSDAVRKNSASSDLPKLVPVSALISPQLIPGDLR